MSLYSFARVCAALIVPEAGDQVRMWGLILIGAAVVILAVVFIIRGVKSKKHNESKTEE